LLAASSAWASSLKPRERAAQKACLLGDYKKGIEILSDLYLDTKDPNYLYNQGRCLEQNGQYEPAILRFEEYLRKAKNLSPADAEDAHKRIDDAQAAIDRRGKPARVEPAPAPAPEPAPPKAIPVLAAAPPPAAPEPLVRPRSLPRASRSTNVGGSGRASARWLRQGS
jgi:tetratricopeptide (TPR) repeat protein